MPLPPPLKSRCSCEAVDIILAMECLMVETESTGHSSWIICVDIFKTMLSPWKHTHFVCYCQQLPSAATLIHWPNVALCVTFDLDDCMLSIYVLPTPYQTEKLRRNDESLEASLEEREKILAEIQGLPIDETRGTAEVSCRGDQMFGSQFWNFSKVWNTFNRGKGLWFNFVIGVWNYCFPFHIFSSS